MQLTLGLDIGGSSIKIGAWTPEALAAGGDPLNWHDGLPIPQSSDPEAVLDSIAGYVRAQLAACSPDARASGLGVGTAGLVRGGEILQSPNTPWDSLPIGAGLEARLAVPVRVLNDADAFLLGALARQQLACSSVLGLVLGTGIGTAILLQGRLIRGGSGISPEAGHMTLDLNGPLGSAGIPGSWEALAGKEALLEDFEKRGGSWSQDAREVETLATQADGGSNAALDALSRYGFCVGAGIASLCNIFSPELVLIGGGIAGARRHFEAAMVEALRLHILRAMPEPRIEWTGLSAQLIALGAARTATGM